MTKILAALIAIIAGILVGVLINVYGPIVAAFAFLLWQLVTLLPQIAVLTGLSVWYILVVSDGVFVDWNPDEVYTGQTPP